MIILSSILFNTVLYCIRVLFSFPLFSEFTDDHIHSNIKSVRDFYDLLEFLQHLGLYNNALRKLCNQLFQYYSILANKQIKYNVIHTYQHTVLSLYWLLKTSKGYRAWYYKFHIHETYNNIPMISFRLQTLEVDNCNSYYFHTDSTSH